MDHPNNEQASHSSLMLLIRKNVDNENIQGVRDAQGMNFDSNDDEFLSMFNPWKYIYML